MMAYATMEVMECICVCARAARNIFPETEQKARIDVPGRLKVHLCKRT